MTSICFYFQVHQPYRLKEFNDGNPDIVERYFDMPLNRQIFQKVAKKCYWPANNLLLELIDRYKRDRRQFRLSFGITGSWLEQCEKFQPDLLETFKQMSASKCVEFVDETYYHSLSSLFENKDEFIEQVKLHNRAIKDTLNYSPTFFRNTECIYNNKIAKVVSDLGYKGILTEGIDWILNGWRSPNFVYKSPSHSGNLKILLRNYRLSDDIGYRFTSRNFDKWPITADKYASWLSASPGDTINLCMDYETFGEHHREDSGIFSFLKYLPEEILRHEHLEFSTLSEVVEKYEPVGEIDVFEFSTISWADMERDVSAWLGNDMQRCCFNEIEGLEKHIKSTDEKLLHVWRLLQTSDHYYYLCTKFWGDGDVHHYFSHMKNQQKAFLNFVSIISDLKSLVLSRRPKEIKNLRNTDYKKMRKELDELIEKIERPSEIPEETIDTILKRLDPKKHAAFIRLLKIWS